MSLTTLHQTRAFRSGLYALSAAILLCACAGLAYDTPPIPESSGTYGWSEKQRIRFRNTRLIKNAHKAIAAEDYDAAKGYLQRIIENDPKNNHAKVFLVDVYERTDRYAEGIKVADGLLVDYPDYLDMYAYKGNMHLKSGQRSQAKTAFESLLERAPKDHKLRADVQKSLVEIYFSDRDFPMARRLGEQLLESEDSLQTRLFLGEVAIQMKNWPAASKHLSKALAFSGDPGQQSDIRFKLSDALFNQERYAEAEPILERSRQSLADKSRLQELIKQQAQTAFNLEKYEQAALFFEEVLKEEFNEASALDMLTSLSKADQLVKGETKATELLNQWGTSPDFVETVLLQQMFFQEHQKKYLEAYTTAQKLITDFEKTKYLLQAADYAEKIGQLDEAIRLYDQYLVDHFSADAAMAVHYARKKKSDQLKDPAAKTALISASIPTLKQVLSQDNLDPEIREGAVHALAQIHRGRGEMDTYFDLVQEGVEEAPEAGFAYDYAVQLYEDQRYDEAIEMFGRSLKDSINKERSYNTCKALADIYLRRSDLDGSLKWLEEATLYGDAKQDRFWQLYMTLVEYRQEKYESVIRRLAPIAGDDSVFNMYIGFSFYEIGMPGLALLHLNQVQDMNSLNAEQKHSLYANRTYLNFDQDQDVTALADAEKSLTYQESEDINLVKLKVLLRSGAYAEAVEFGSQLVQKNPNRALREEILAMLDEHPNPEFRNEILADLQNIGDTKYEAELYELIGLGQFRNEEPAKAIASFTRALELDDHRTSSYYLRGLSQFRVGEFEEAEADFLRLYDLAETFPATFWGDLGILQGDLEDYDLGTAALDRSTSFYPYEIEAYEELGYQYKKTRRNQDAKVAFKQALDLYAEILPYMDDESYYDYNDDSRAMKTEFTKLDRTWGLQAYLQSTDFDIEKETKGTRAQADSIGGALVSQAGVGIAYRPPSLGFRNDKELDFFLRVLANLQRDSFDPDEETYQGGAGVMYKPLRRHNFRTSMERLFKIGDNSENNWLWRNSYGWEQGDKPQKYESVWLYNQLYGEISYYLEDVKRWVYYMNPKAGYSFLLNTERLTLTVPELVGVARYQSNDDDGLGTYYYGGVGANLKWLSSEKAYSVDRWYLDFYAHYVWGRFSETPSGSDAPDFEGVVFGFNWTK